MMSVFFQAEDGIRDIGVTGVQTCALPICHRLCLKPLESSFHLARMEFRRCADPGPGERCARGTRRDHEVDRKSVVQGKSVDLGGRRIIKKKKRVATVVASYHVSASEQRVV